MGCCEREDQADRSLGQGTPPKAWIDAEAHLASIPQH